MQGIKLEMSTEKQDSLQGLLKGISKCQFILKHFR